jgi:hypothetical protein
MKMCSLLLPEDKAERGTQARLAVSLPSETAVLPTRLRAANLSGRDHAASPGGKQYGKTA